MRAIVAALLVCGAIGCRRHAPVPGAPVSAAGAPVAAPAGGPMQVEIRGTIQALDGLPAMKGILVEAQGQEQLADGTWAVKALLSSGDLVDTLRARGLAVKVLQTPEQLAREGEQIAHELEASERGRRDAGPH